MPQEITDEDLEKLNKLIVTKNDKLNKIITDQQLDHAWGNADFGASVSKREVLRNGLLKIVCGYHNGQTLQCIIQELGLTGTSHMKSECLTKKGKEYLYEAFKTSNI